MSQDTKTLYIVEKSLSETASLKDQYVPTGE